MQVYGHGALEMLRREGAEAIEIWCVSSGSRCSNRVTVPIGSAIERWGPGMPLVLIARRARCRSCGGRGAHVQLAAPPAGSSPRYEWDQRRILWLRSELARLEQDIG